MDGDKMPTQPYTAAMPQRPVQAPRLPAAVAELWLPVLIFAGMQLSAQLATLMQATAIGGAAWAGGFAWGDAERWSVWAALLAPFMLAGAHGTPARNVFRPVAALIPSYAAFSALVTTAAWIDGSLFRIGWDWLVLWLGLGFVTTSLLRVVFIRRLAVSRVAMVGAGPDTDRLIRQLQQDYPGIELIGVFDDRGTRLQGFAHRSQGSVTDLVELGKRRRIDWILVSLPAHAEARVASVVGHLKSLAVSVGLAPPGIALAETRQRVGYVSDGLPVTLLADRPIRRWGRVVKGVEDYLLGGLITLALLPLMGLIALAVKLDSPGPVLFRQPRHGWNNREFQVLKFRSMRWNPEAQQVPLAQTARDDARITPLGRFLRRTSLDELPQLFNVLRGDMSLVGPRPHAVDMRTEERLGAEIVATYAQRHRVLPGLTGWAQVHGCRGATDTAEQLRRRIELDLAYIDNWSIWLDLKILIMTSWIVIRGTNAY